ncbi:response regulator [Microbulbifer epialgicus]|uniref:histidine kinase n=1 Tax=Microbulbifer epialgicus TaxID=393907 RepID=A0ABV4NTZ3_9GAMM
MKALIRYLRSHVSIKKRLLLMFFIPGIVYYLFSTALSFSHIQGISNARSVELRSVVKSAVGKTSAQFISRGLKKDLEEVLHSLISDTAVNGVIVYDVDNTIFAQVGDISPRTNVAVYEHKIFHKPIIPSFDEIDFNDGVSKGDAEQIGNLKFFVDQAIVEEDSWQAAIGDLAILFIIILICSPLFYALYQSFNNPLSSILNNILEFEKGNLDWIQRNDKGDDEFTRVQQALKRVARTQIDQTRQIREANLTLKQRALELEHQVKIATEAREEADRANAQKDIFVANVTHEMRHPLAGVVSGVDLVEQFILCAQHKLMELNNSVTPEQFSQLIAIRTELKDAISSLGISKTSSKDLTIMVDDLLTSIQDMHQEILLRPTTFLLYDSLDILFRSHYENATSKGLDYQFEIKGLEIDSPLYVKGDWVRISQVVNSLLENAIRFTEQGTVSITVEVSIQKGNVNLHFVISDTGVGISDNEKESIFKLFHIGEKPSDKQYSGLGTGLTIAHKIAERIKGELNLEHSELGVGSRFYFNLKLPVSSAKDIIPYEIKNSVEKRLSILYVEDSAMNRQLFSSFCKIAGIDLILAQNGQEGIERYKSHHFDGLIVDCYMPKMNGYDFVRKIRQWEKEEDSGHIPIFALTADASTRNRERCFNAGYDEFLTKPYTRSTFRFIIDRIDRYNSRNHRA